MHTAKHFKPSLNILISTYAFEYSGDFKDAEVNVHSNELTQFEESVFGPMLQEMASGKGFVNAGGDSGSIKFK